VHSFTDAAISVCPECGKDVRKIYSNVGIVFKGSGFYKTDSQTKTSDSKPTTAPATPSTSD
jgi:predicted nucleic acid-binding Zn ribbon protein